MRNDLEHLDSYGHITRRHFFGSSAAGIGSVALASLLGSFSNMGRAQEVPSPITASPNLRARAKRVIYLFQAGGPAQQDLFDYKPLLNEKHGEQLPAGPSGLPACRPSRLPSRSPARRSSSPSTGNRAPG
jgi:uncharacterized protein DUF1501